jgi:hypothetical protein
VGEDSWRADRSLKWTGVPPYAGSGTVGVSRLPRGVDGAAGVRSETHITSLGAYPFPYLLDAQSFSNLSLSVSNCSWLRSP